MECHSGREKLRRGRYALFGELARGGMATVHVGRLFGPGGFTRTVAIKRLHTQLAQDPEFVAMFMDEARLAARIRHPNVVSIIDVVTADGELLLVMEYIPGESLGRLLRSEWDQARPVPRQLCLRVVYDVLVGLHAAHESRSEQGEPLGVVHRDVSPQNILVGIDGVSRIIDFGVAKAAGRIQNTREGQVKGKVAYMAPEQICLKRLDRRTDIYSAGVVLWEALTGRRLFTADHDAALMYEVLEARIPWPSEVQPGIPEPLDRIVMKATSRHADARYSDALEMADALEEASPMASTRDVARWVARAAAEVLASRAQQLADVESQPIPSGSVAVPLSLVEGVRQRSPSLESDSDSTVAGTDSRLSRRPFRRFGPSAIVLAAGLSLAGGGMALLRATGSSSPTVSSLSGPGDGPGEGTPLPLTTREPRDAGIPEADIFETRVFAGASASGRVETLSATVPEPRGRAKPPRTHSETPSETKPRDREKYGF